MEHPMIKEQNKTNTMERGCRQPQQTQIGLAAETKQSERCHWEQPLSAPGQTLDEIPLLRRLGLPVWAALSAHKITIAGLTVFLAVAQAPAASFLFSTGNPDGKIATLARPATPGKLQTETADDFNLTETTLLNRATFTGLL